MVIWITEYKTTQKRIQYKTMVQTYIDIKKYVYCVILRNT